MYRLTKSHIIKMGLGLSLILLMICTSCSCYLFVTEPETEVPSQIDPEQAEQLVNLFCPAIYLKGEGDIKEVYEPEPIEIIIDQASVRDIQNPTFLERATLSGLLQWSNSIYYLDILDLEPDTQSVGGYESNYNEVKDQYQTTIYARVKEDADNNCTVIQYWIFYYFNDWRNLHEGDWELVELCFLNHTVQGILENQIEPTFAAYSQHQAGQKMSCDKMISNGLVTDTHPKVYVARGSHANYFTPGSFWSGLDFDDTGLFSWDVINPEQINVVLLQESQTAEEGLNWLDFKGYWGEYRGFAVSILGLKFWQHGPFGPTWAEGEKQSEKWAKPYEWADRLPEYPKPFWTYFLNILGDWKKLAIFSLFSPANLEIYDGQDRHVGVDQEGNLQNQIPGAIYINPEGTDYKIILVPDADISHEYVMVVNGTDSGSMDIKAQVPDAKSQLNSFLEYIDIPVSPTLTARAAISPDITALMRLPPVAEVAEARVGTVRDMTTMLEIDSDRDGIFESQNPPGIFKKQETQPMPFPEKR